MSILRTLVKILIFFDDKDSLDILSTHLLTSAMPDDFLTLLETMVDKNLDTREMENVFISLIAIHSFELKTIDKFLLILKKDPSYLINQLLDDANYTVLKTYIFQLGKECSEIILQHVVPSILCNFKGNELNYFGIVEKIIEVMPSATQPLLHDSIRLGICESSFQNYLIWTQISNLSVIKNFMSYLKYDPKKFNSFEDSFLSCAEAGSILEYALQVADSNKRKILRRLVELKKEDFLVKFIENFPEYDSLLLML